MCYAIMIKTMIENTPAAGISRQEFLWLFDALAYSERGLS